MARILYITTGMTSMVNAGVELADRLRSRGHEVEFASHRDCGPSVADAGFQFTHLKRDHEIHAAYETAQSKRERLAARRRSIQNTEIEELVTGVKPDLMLIDMELHFALLVTRPLGIRTAIPVVWYSVFQSATNPPLHTSFTPDDGLRARAAWVLLWANRTRRLGRERIAQSLRLRTPKPLDYSCRSRLDLAELARSRGVRIRAYTKIYEWLNPHTYSRLDVISFNPTEMEFAEQQHPFLHYVGPMINGRVSDRTDMSKWSAFASNRDPTRPLVYCSLGSFWDIDHAFLHKVIDVFRQRSEWDLVLGLGNKADPSEFENIPENVLLLSWAPQVEILRHSSAAVTHGGISTINECIANGVPMVGYSTGRVDQNGCVARLVYHGLGVAGDRSSDGPREIESALATVMTSGEFRARCEAMGAVADAYRTSGRAEDVIESLLS